MWNAATVSGMPGKYIVFFNCHFVIFSFSYSDFRDKQGPLMVFTIPGEKIIYIFACRFYKKMAEIKLDLIL